MTERVRITDVSPRDGLQNEPGVIPTADKVALVRALCATGVDEIEVSSFVSAKWVPQLGDASEVFRGLAEIGVEALSPAGGVRPAFSALVPNMRGMEEALALRAAGAPLDKIAVFTAASETFSRRNTNATIAQTIERFGEVVKAAVDAPGGALPVRGYISCAVACPFEGPVAPGKVADVAAMLLALGIEEIDLGDTIGAGTPETIVAVIDAVRERMPGSGTLLTLHLHDTFGRAGDCIRAALGRGVRSFDGSVAGLGGCPYAGTPQRPAPGNVSTELLVNTVKDAGRPTLVNEPALARAGDLARSIVSRARAATRPGDAL